MNPPPAPPFFLFLGFSTHPPNQILTAPAQNLARNHSAWPGDRSGKRLLSAVTWDGSAAHQSGGWGIQWAPTDWRVRPFTRRGLGNQCRRGRPRSPLGSVHAGGVGLGRSARVRGSASTAAAAPGSSATFAAGSFAQVS